MPDLFVKEELRSLWLDCHSRASDEALHLEGRRHIETHLLMEGLREALATNEAVRQAFLSTPSVARVVNKWAMEDLESEVGEALDTNIKQCLL